MWPSLIAKAKAGGLDVIQTLVFWNLHEPQFDQVSPSFSLSSKYISLISLMVMLIYVFFFFLQFDFSGRRDIVRFIKEVQAQGLYVSLRIGPFIQGEWAYG